MILCTFCGYRATKYTILKSDKFSDETYLALCTIHFDEVKFLDLFKQEISEPEYFTSLF